MIVVLLLLIAFGLFAAAFAIRVGAARRATLVRKWPSFALGAVAILLLFRGAWQPAAALAACAWLAWLLWPPQPRPRRPQAGDADRDARFILGVGPNATEAEIREAFRERMRSAHPDRGGSNAAAARLTAARDRLLRRRKG